MSAVTLIISSLLALSLAYFIVLMLIRIRNNVVTGLSYREALQAQIADLRLNRMLGALGINKQRYMHQQSIIDIHSHMERCRDCTNTHVCDEKLESNTIEKDKIDFCNNAETLNRIAGQQEEPGT